MRVRIGDGITYRAELVRVGAEYKRVERTGHGYIIQLINNELIYVWNGIRLVLIHRTDIIIKH